MAKASGYDEDELTTLSDINVVPLVDVVLVLLIVFMITVPAVIGSAPIKVDLPETTSVAMGAVEDLPLHLFLKRDKSTGKAQLYMNDGPTSEAALQSLLKNSYVKSTESPATYLAFDKDVTGDDLVKVLDMLNRLGLTKLSLDTKHVNK